MTLTADQIHAYQHTLVCQRVAVLIDGDLKGRHLQNARDLLAFTLLGHARLYPHCERRLSLSPAPWPAPNPRERVG